MAKPKRFCSIDDCGKPAFGHGMCSKHYQRWKRYGRVYNLPEQPTKPNEKLPLPIHLAREEWIIYAAGFFDGEGCVQIAHRRNTKVFYLKISAVQKNPKPLRILQGLFGGGIRTRKTAPFMWEAASQKAFHALQEMLPYLIVKRKPSEIALAFQSRIGRAIRNGVSDKEAAERLHMREEIQRLNHLD
jgi:hypothetical protein